MTINVKTDDIIVVSGRKQSGKSYFITHLIRNFKRRIIWDYNHEHGDLGFVTNKPKEIVKAFADGLTHVVFQPLDKSPEAFDTFLAEAWKLWNYMLVVEEVERFTTPKYIPPSLRKFIDVGRHHGVGIIVTCRRLKIWLDFPANADHCFVFAQHLPQDIEYWKEWIGTKAEWLKTMPEYYFVHYEAKTNTISLRSPV